MVVLDTAISAVLSNKRRVGALKALGVVSIRDLITYYPFRVSDPVPVRHLHEAKIGESMAFTATVRSLRVMPMAQRRGHRLEVIVQDDTDTASASLIFFSHKQYFVNWMSTRLEVGATIVVQGEPGVYNERLQFTHPEIQVLGKDCASLDLALSRVSRPRPVYHANSRISSEHIHDTIMNIMRMLVTTDASTDDHSRNAPVSKAGAKSAEQSLDIGQSNAFQPLAVEELSQKIPDILPQEIIERNHLLHRAQAFLSIHEPDTVSAFKDALGTLRFEEAFISQTALLRTKADAKTTTALPCAGHESDTLVQRFIADLPFTLTDGQDAVIAEIRDDMAQSYPMQRLLQGEVGSGKTIVSLTAMLRAVGADQQAVLVAPTQILAEQHVQTICQLLGKKLQADSAYVGQEFNGELASIPVVLLTGGMRLAERRKALAVASSGKPCIIIATHAAFSKTFQAPNLGLVVIDEQHRFGVEQRNVLRNKSEHAPHLLVMTATPIPRTAALTWFGDLDLSWLTELPGGRKPIRTTIIQEHDATMMAAMFVHIRKRVDAGERAYIVCPRIDDDDEIAAKTASTGKHSASQESEINNFDEFSQPDMSEESREAESLPPLHSVTTIASRLSALPQFAGLHMVTLTGRDDDDTKTQIMHEFSVGTSPILVATTVVEVGMDVPEATSIVVFDADRFGLSQLHQLRGRVGRGGKQSWAFFISRATPDSIAAQRLEVIKDSTDGAEIAQADMQLRGAGDVLGDAQSGGRSSLKLLRVITDAKIIAQAREQADEILQSDPELAHEVQLAGAVLDFMRGNERFLTST